jgi:hypothetical protein
MHESSLTTRSENLGEITSRCAIISSVMCIWRQFVHEFDLRQMLIHGGAGDPLVAGFHFRFFCPEEGNTSTAFRRDSEANGRRVSAKPTENPTNMNDLKQH